MWTHYGDGHTGFCIEYKIDDQKLLSKFNLVSYENQHNGSVGIDRAFKDWDAVEDTLLHIMTTKPQSLDYEKEWRMIGFKFVDGNRLVDMPLSISSIIFGTKAKKNQVEAVIKIAMLMHGVTRFYQMFPTTEKFSLVRKPIEFQRDA